ncbi:LysR substrate-binding domain-containing protein, partial [Pandoraea sputorum]|uniref:LysR substrate-binding domain-containing protein n=1 Tax=Pandoraea sputorum TaxID=93222 RepID=UPI00355874DE
TRRNIDNDREQYQFEALGNEELIAVVHSAHPLPDRETLQWDELVRDWPWILQPQSSPARIAFDQALLRQQLPMPADIIECSSVYSMQQLVQLTDAAMVLSESAMRDYLKMGLVKALPLTIDVFPTPTLPLSGWLPAMLVLQLVLIAGYCWLAVRVATRPLNA